MAEDFKIGLGVELKSGELDNIRNQINNIRVNPITLTMNTGNVQNQLNSIRTQIRNLSNIRINLTGGNGNTGVHRTVADVTRAYNDLINLTRRISSIRTTLPTLDAGKNSSEIAELSGQLNRLMTDYNNLYQVFNRNFSTDQLDSLNRAFDVTSDKISVLNAKMTDTSAVKNQTQAYRELFSISEEIGSLELNIAKLKGQGGNSNQIAELETQLRTLQTTYQQIVTTIQTPLTSEQWGSLYNQIAQTQNKLAVLDSKFADTKAKFASGITAELGTNIKNEVDKAEVSFSKLNLQSTEITNSMQNLRIAFEDMNLAKTKGDVDGLIDAYEKYKIALKDVNSQIAINVRAEKEAADVTKLSDNKTAFQSKIDVWLKNNSAAAKKFGDALLDLRERSRSCDKVTLNHLESEFKEIIRQAELAGKATQTFGDKLKDQFSQYGVYLSAATMISYASQALRNMYDNVVEIDTAMTDLLKVTDETDAAYQRFMKNAGKNAQDLGRSVSSYIQQSANWAKMGYDTVESAELAKISSVYSNVADVDDDTAVSDIVTAMKAFNIEAKNAVTIIDPLNKLSNEFAVTAAGLGQGLSKSASTMATAGTDLERTLALLTGISEITQSPEEAGNFLKVAVARIQGMKGTLEELGEEVDESVDSISKVQTQILNLTKGEVNIFDDSGEFRDYYEIMEDIAGVIDELTSTDRASLVEILFGKNRMNQGLAMLQAFQSGQIGKAFETIADGAAAGSAAAEQEKWMNSLEAKIGSLEAAWQSLSETFLDSDSLKGAIDLLTDFVNVLDFIIERIGTINAVIAGIGIGKVVNKISSVSKAAGGLSKIGDITSLLSLAFPKAAKGVGIFTKAMSNGAKGAGLFKAAASGLWTVIKAHPIIATVATIGTLISIFGNLETAEEKSRKAMEESFDAYEDAKQKVINVNSELETTKSRMDELEAKGGLTFVEKQELEDLKEATRQLERQAEIVKQEEIRKGKEAAKSQEEYYNTNYKNKDFNKNDNDLISEENINNLYNKYGTNELDYYTLIADKYNLDNILAAYKAIAEKRDEAYKSVSEFINKSEEDLTLEEETALSSYYAILEALDTTEGMVSISLTDLQNRMNELLALPEESLNDNQKNLIDIYSNTIDAIWKLYQPEKFKQMKFDEIFDDEAIAKAKEGAVEFASANKYVGITIDKLKTKYPELVSAVEEAFKNAGLEFMIQDLVDNINSEAGVVNLDELVNQAIEKLKDSMPEDEEAVDVYVGAEISKASAEEVNAWLNSLEEEEREIACNIILNNDTSGWDLDNYEKELQKATDKFTEEQKQKVIDGFKDNSISAWFNNLPEDEKNLVYKIGVESDDTTLWSLTRWQQEMAYLKEHSETATASIKSFYNVMNNAEDGNFSEIIDNYRSSISSLRDYLKRLKADVLTYDEKLTLTMDFPELTPYINNTNALELALSNLIDTKNQDMNNGFNAQIEALGGVDTAAGQALLTLQNLLNTALSIDFDLEDEIDKFNNLYSAISESISGTGLSTESINNIKEMFSDLPNYDKFELFEHTANGIHLNEEALKDLQKEYEKTKKKDLRDELKDLQDEYDKTKSELEGLTKGTNEYDRKLAELNGIADQINDVQTLATQYDGLTSSYNKWIKAQSAGNERDSYESIGANFEDMQKTFNEGWYGDESLNAYLDLILGAENRTDDVIKDFEKLGQVIDGTGRSILDYWSYDEDGKLNAKGLYDFLDDVNAKLGSEFAGIENGKYYFDFSSEEKMQEVAKAFGISTELVGLLSKAMIDAGFTVKMGKDGLTDYSSELEKLAKESEEARAKLKELALEKFGISIEILDYDIATMSLEDIESKIKELEEAKVSIDVSTEEGQQMIDSLSAEIERLRTQETSLKVATTVKNGKSVDELLKMDDTELSVALNIDISQVTTAKEQLQLLQNKEISCKIAAVIENGSSVDELLAMDDSTLACTLNINTSAVETARAELEKLKTNETAVTVKLDESQFAALTNKTVTVEAEAVGDEEVDALQENIGETKGADVDVEAKVTGTDDVTELSESIGVIPLEQFPIVEADVSGIDDVETLGETIDELPSRKTIEIVTITRTGTGEDDYSVKKSISDSSGGGAISGPNAKYLAMAQGTAFKRGDWGTKDSGVALMGELGPEMIVRGGKYYTVGNDSAEFVKYQKDDIIFNAEQTRQLLSKGKISTGSKRGSAFATGTAFANEYVTSGKGGLRGLFGESTTLKDKTASKKSSSKKSSSAKEDADDFKETFDWIEVAIDRVERAISNLDLKASSVYRSWSSRNKNLKKEISTVGEEIKIQQAGYERYLQEANSVGLDESWAKLVRNGEIDIDTITDEVLAEKIKSYQEWYDKALDCKYAVDELKETESELYQQAFDNIVAQYDGFLSVIEHERNMLEEYISQSEASGYIVSTKYYDALINVEKANVEKLENEKNALLTSLEEAVNSGTIKPDSEAWHNMVSEIDEVTIAITEANTSLIEMNNSIREIEWSVFDLLQDQISQVAEEAGFLIDLLSNEKLYDDKGQLTDEGMATMGLHGQNYNVYMAQADKYAKELLDINKELADDPYNQTLIERRQELLELQQESILAAEDEKQAIVDMVREGIELELDALQERIDKYNEAMDSAKDLYDYQKNIRKQTEEIASLEKQMSAYAGDTSEETMSKIQEIKVSLEEAKENLEETEYDRYISDQKQLLDELFAEYELILNQRLDNVDLLISDMITEVNTSASNISATLSAKADEVGYTLSDTMKTTWDTNTTNITTVLTTYGQGIQEGIATASTTLNTALSTLSSNIQNMITELNKSASKNVQYSTTSSSAYSSQAQSSVYDSSTAINTGSSSSKSSNSSSSSSSSNSIKTTSSSSKSSSSNKSSSSSSSSSNKSSSSSKSSSDDNFFDYKKDTYPKSKLNTETSIVDRLKYSNYDSSFSARRDYYKEMGFSGTYTGSAKQNSNMVAWMKKNGYKNGVYKLSKNELAWTQEGSSLEAIIRPSDGAILTPLAKNDSVLNASATSNIFDFANDPSTFIRDNLNIVDSVSNAPSQNVGSNTYHNEFGIQIELPNVQNYEQFKYAMQHDKSFEKMVRAMTVDKMFGGSSLKKYKC